MILQKFVKILINNPRKDVPLDYEMAGKILDNLLIMAENQGFDINDPKFDKTLTFAVGKVHEYMARLWQTKTAFMFEIGYLREIPKDEQIKKPKELPKDKKFYDDLKAQEKKRQAELKKKEKDGKKKVVVDEDKK